MEQEAMQQARTVRRNYRMLGISAIGMLILMYLIMFAMIYSWGEFINNVNFFYMAVMMAVPMTVMMPLMMGSMYTDKKLNMFIYGVGAALFVLAFIAIRGQLLVGDRQFLHSMIPHHSGSILMCKEARLSDPQVKSLCNEIIESQVREIDEMRAILARK